MAVAGAMALGVCAVELWRRGPSGRMVLALLVLCWSFNTALGVAGPTAILALSLHFGAKRFAPLLKSPCVLATWIFTVVVATIWNVRLFARFAATFARGVRELCAREDAPAWIIAPLELGKELLAGKMKLWRLPEPQFQLTKGDGAYVWRKIDAFGVIPCAGQESAGLRMLKQK